MCRFRNTFLLLLVLSDSSHGWTRVHSTSSSPPLHEDTSQKIDVSEIWILSWDGVHNTDFILFTFYQGAWLSAHFASRNLATTRKNFAAKYN